VRWISLKLNNELNDSELKKIRLARNAYIKKWRAKNPDYNKNCQRIAYRKDPAKFKAYQNKYWLKKANEEELQKLKDI